MTQLKLQQQIDEALANLKQLVQRAVREEQLIDRLSGLGNNEALDAWVQHNLDADGQAFWLAFVEVDRFKSINDEFGYDAADELLRRISAQLQNGATNFFHHGATPFRAHGDEFFIGGLGDGSGVHEALEQIRLAIAALRVKPPDRASATATMQATVSVGWATDQDARSSVEVLTTRALRGVLEASVASAKVNRNCVVRFVSAHQKSQMRNGRADCGNCHAKFDLRVPVTDDRAKSLFCPNCGAEVERPAGLRPG